MDTDALRELAAGLPGPLKGEWRAIATGEVVCGIHVVCDCTPATIADDDDLAVAGYLAAASPAAVLALLDRLDRLAGENARLREALAPVAEWIGQRSDLPDGPPLCVDFEYLARPSDLTVGHLRRLAEAVKP